MGQLRVASQPLAEFEDLPLNVLLRINNLADRFETAWRAGLDPDITEFEKRLESSDLLARRALREHLNQLAAELDSRGRPDSPSNMPDRENLERIDQQAPFATQFLRENLPRRPLSRTDSPLAAQPVLLGEYQILERLGAGGMGIVYKAFQRRLARMVAIKFPRFATELEPRSSLRFLREAKLIGRLSHPHIVRALDAGDSPYGPYLVTELLEGETLESLVRRAGPLPLELALALTSQAASALGYAHAQGIIHRDIKPSNLYLDSEGRLQILDFGLAKLRFEDGTTESSHSSERTQSGTFLGSIGYAAPEQLCGGNGVDHRADIYALGCVLYFMLTARPPHVGPLTERLQSAHKELAPLLRRARPDLPRRVDAVWRRMIASSPSKRISSMAAVESSMRSMETEPFVTCSLRPPNADRRFLGAVAAGALVLAFAAILGAALPGRESETRPTGVAAAPFSSFEAQRYQQQWAARLGLPVRIVNKTEMPLVLIPAGEFDMGMSPAPAPAMPVDSLRWQHRNLDPSRLDQAPQHRVTLSRPYYLGETEVTVGQFRRFVESIAYVTEAESGKGWGMEGGNWVERAGYCWHDLGEWQPTDEHPVNNVTWNDAVAFCEWLTSHCNRRYRLPTEAEWEFACRAGTTTTFYFGNDPSDLAEHAWTQANSGGIYWPVARKRANPFGLYDMYGNRHEWCLDTYEANFYASSPVVDPVNRTKGPDAVMRGGMHASPPAFATSAHRWRQDRSATNYAGFRVLMEVEQP